MIECALKSGHIKEYRAHQDTTQPKKHTLRIKANHPEEF